MKKLLILIAALCALSASAETYTGLVVDKGGACIITNPDNPLVAIVNLKWNLSPDVQAYVGKVVKIEGVLDSTKTYPTMESITSITEVK